METDDITSTGGLYPVLLIPKTCTTLETNCEASDNVFINLTITSPDTEGNETCIYTGFCNVKLIESSGVTQDDGVGLEHSVAAPANGNNRDQMTLSNTGSTYPPYSQSQVWMDPAISPYVYNNCNTGDSKEQYSIYQSQSGHITVEQHNTYITQNVYNFRDSDNYSPPDEFEHKKFRKVQNDTDNQNCLGDQILYEDNEFECGVFMSKLPEEIWNENEARAREEMKYVGLQTENNALKQLMSTDIQSLSKQHKTILFLGHDSHFGQTIQKIAFSDPNLECTGAGSSKVDHEVIIVKETSHSERTTRPSSGTGTDGTNVTRANQKKYQCDKCKQIFDQIVEFKEHMTVANHKSPKIPVTAGPSEVKFMCLECGKNLKNQEKFEQHCLGHGDPDLECNKCHKVFASKFTLRTHSKIHERKYPCKYCSKSYTNFEELKSHAAKIHFVFMCQLCPFTADTFNVLRDHRSNHTELARGLSDMENNEDDLISESGTLSPIPEHSQEVIVQDPMGLDTIDEISKADSIIAKVVSNKIFLRHTKKRRGKKYKNTCDVCMKSFDRVGDLKRHLIEHVIRSTLAKNPVSHDGVLKILCEVCQLETFSKIDKYKAHLREHAKLTLYKCTFCDKSFSDSSNFSKHKKIHGITFYQCDLCQRKFNSKKMITQHIEYHNKNEPIQCEYCEKAFYFESMLNKHIKCAHAREEVSRFRCRFCNKYFKSLKEKWDHEWTVHNVRKMIVDCMICGAKYRKYSELKRHCSDIHEIDIPLATKLLKKGKTT